MAGVHAAASNSSEHKVHFDASQLQAHDSDIGFQYSDGKIDVHLGFLQINRHYQITFNIQDDLGEDIVFDPLQNLHVKIKEYAPTEDGLGHELVVDFHAHREKLLQEKVTIKSTTDSTKFTDINFHCRVLGKGKGTPALRNGIHCTGIDADNDSDATDWQGFD